MKVAIFPGSFDPVTYGHLDLIERGAKLFDQLIVVVSQQQTKKYLFTQEKRVNFLQRLTSHLSNVQIVMHQTGLLVDLAQHYSASILLRGLRNSVDFEYEKTLEQLNYSQNKQLETVYLMTRLPFQMISSSAVKELAQLNGNLNEFVPLVVKNALKQKFNIVENLEDEI